MGIIKEIARRFRLLSCICFALVLEIAKDLSLWTPFNEIKHLFHNNNLHKGNLLKEEMGTTEQPQIYRIPEYVPTQKRIYFSDELQYDLKQHMLGRFQKKEASVLVGTCDPLIPRGTLAKWRLSSVQGGSGYELRPRAWEEVVRKADEFGTNLITLEMPKVLTAHQYHFFDVQDASLQKALERYLLPFVRTLEMSVLAGQQVVMHPPVANVAEE